jgi:hypothetical protein
LIRRFFAWYVPYFEAYTLPVARSHEFEADDAAADVAGREVAASCLVSGILAGRWVEEAYWPSVYRRADQQASPPATAFAPLAERIAEAPAYGNVEAAFRMLMDDEPEVTDTHPTLKERLDHLGVKPETALAAATSPGRDSAADAYLGDRKSAVVEAVDRYWTALIEPQWRGAHAEALTAKQRLAQLNGVAERTPDGDLERAELTERFEGDDAALDLYRALVDGEHDAPARFSIGRILLGREDDAGLRWLDQAMDRDEEAVVPACELAIGYLKEQGRDDEAARYFERGNQGVAVLEAAAEERAGVSLDDRLEAPDLPDELLESLRQKLRWREEIEEAYLVRKRVEKLAASHPFYVLAFVPKGGFRALWKEAKDEESEQETVEEWLVRMVEAEVPGELMVARIDKDSPIGRRLTSVDDALLFVRN